MEAALLPFVAPDIMAPPKSKAKGQVPETILKKRKRDEEWATKKAALVAETKKKSKANRKDIFKRAEQYVKEYRDQVLASAVRVRGCIRCFTG